MVGLVKDNLGGKIMTEFARLRPKAYSYLIDNGRGDKKAKGTKKCVLKRRHKFEDSTEEVNMIGVSSNDDKRLHTFNGIASYAYGTNAGKSAKHNCYNIKKLKY